MSDGLGATGQNQFSDERAWELIRRQRFGNQISDVKLGDIEGGHGLAWSSEDSACFKDTVPEALQMVLRAHDGYPSIVALRSMLKDRACRGNDIVCEEGPPLYLALAYAPDHVRMNLHQESDWPTIFFDMYARSLNDIRDILMGSISFPESVAPLSLAEAESMGAPSLAGWLKVHWV